MFICFLASEKLFWIQASKKSFSERRSFIIIIVIIIIIIIIIIINIFSIYGFDTIIYLVFYLRPHASLLGRKILAGKYIIRDISIFTYIQSISLNIWTVIVSASFYISCSDDFLGIWQIKFCVPFFIMAMAPVTSGVVLEFSHFLTSVSRTYI